MIFALAFIAALSLSMAIIPLMVRVAPRLGMIDVPDQRKVHAIPIPRVGGVGIVIGAVAPVFLLLPHDPGLYSFMFGALVLLVFGAWDDARELGHYVKFIGQFIAVLTVVYLGDEWVNTLPFDGMEHIPAAVGKPFTVFAMVGTINAINHSDGLDGLAGGESLMSLVCIAYLAWLSDGITAVTIALATVGGIFGFLRFNSYPAKVFMGDGGSQFIGFTLAYLTVVLLRHVDPVLSPALPALILGLPIVDIIAVFAMRVSKGMNWFKATKNHIHHRLLELGFDHYESVVIIYSVQALLVICAIPLRYESDGLILGIYLSVCATVFTFLMVAESKGWVAHKEGAPSALRRLIENVKSHQQFLNAPAVFLMIALPVFLVASPLMATYVPRDFSIASAILFIFLLAGLVYGRASWVFLRAIIFPSVAFGVYLLDIYPPGSDSHLDSFVYAFFGVIVVSLAIVARYAPDRLFRFTPMDFLVVLLVVLMGIMPEERPVSAVAVAILIKIIILFYACEYLISRSTKRWNGLTASTLACLALIAVRGILI